MKLKFFAIICVLISLILVVAPATTTHAQEFSIGVKAKQRSVEVQIGDDGEKVHVTHVIRSTNSPAQVDLIDGTVENLTVSDEDGREHSNVTVIGDNDAILIFLSNTDLIVEYDLKDILLLKGNVWTWDFLYLESTTFVLSKNIDLIFVNDTPVYLKDKRGFMCHGCSMTLEYSFNEPKNIRTVNWENREFVVEVRTFAELKGFDFNQQEKRVSFNVNDDSPSVTVVIPLELLWTPYSVFLNDEKIHSNEFANNGTHAWLNIRPESSGGDIAIIGTTVVPEFPITATMIVGFVMMITMILLVPRMKKINLH